MSKYNKPCILCSFGKDSLALLHVIRTMGYKIPVVFHREPFMPKKYEFADRIIRDWDLSVYDYPPTAMGFMTGNGLAHTINYHQAGGKQLARATGLHDFTEGKDYLCALEDLINRPRVGQVEFPWDICFHGHKSTDIDPVTGPVPLTIDILAVEGSSHYAYPLRNWTDQDVWMYLEAAGVPINFSRYLKTEEGYKDNPDKSLNSDYFPACWRCIDRDEESSVHCPKKNKKVSNVSSSIHYDPLKLEYMNKQN